MAFSKPGIGAPAKRADSSDTPPHAPAAASGQHAATLADKEPRSDAHRAVIMQRLAAMKAATAGPVVVPAPPPAPEPRKSLNHAFEFRLQALLQHSPAGGMISRS